MNIGSDYAVKSGHNGVDFGAVTKIDQAPPTQPLEEGCAPKVSAGYDGAGEGQPGIYALPPSQYLQWRYAHPDPEAAELLKIQQHQSSVFLTVRWMKEYYEHRNAN
jgi:hypothetical protein